MKSKSIYRFIENVFSLFSVKAIDLGLAIWLIPYLIFKVGIQNYGLYVFAISLMLFFVNISNYGFNLVAVRILAKNSKNSDNITNVFNEVFSVKLYLTGFLLLLLLFLIVTVPIFSENKSIYIFASLLLIGDLFSLRWFFLGLEKMKFIPIINLAATLIYVVLVLLFVNQPLDYTYIVLWEAIGVLTVGIVSFLFVIKWYSITIKIVPFVTVQKYLVSNFSSFLNLLVPSVLSNVAVFMVGLFSIPAHVSIIQLGVKFSNAFSTINAILTKVFYPIVNRSFGAMKTSFSILISLGILLSIAMFFSADFLIKPWLKIDDETVIQQVSFIIKLLSPTPFLMALISAFGVNGLLVYQKDKLFRNITIITTLIGGVVGFILIPTYSYIGGAVFLLTARGLYALFSIGFLTKVKFKAKSLKI